MRYLIVALALSFASPAYALEEIGDDAPASSSSSGPSRRFGLGIMLGEPSALTGKFFLSEANAVQLHLGYAFRRHHRLVVIADYLFHINGLIPPIERAGTLTPYVGIGGRLGTYDDDHAFFGVRIPAGMSFMLNGVPLEVFLEIAIGLGLIPDTRGIFDGGLGVRFYF